MLALSTFIVTTSFLISAHLSPPPREPRFLFKVRLLHRQTLHRESIDRALRLARIARQVEQRVGSGKWSNEEKGDRLGGVRKGKETNAL